MADRPVTDLLTGYSRGMYANWLWHRRLQVIVDAGEGLTLALGTSVFAPNVIAITHGHSDHVLGLAGFAGARRFGKGSTTKAWTVLYPAGSPGVLATRAQIAGLWRDVEFPITWVEMADGDEHPLAPGLFVQAFVVRHVPPDPALGYRVVERRRRLRAELMALPQPEIERMVRERGRDVLMEEYHHIQFVHSGDAMPIDPALARHADILVHDATFLGSEERREPIHATSDEALAVARDANVRALVLNHLSIRYDRAEALPRLREQLAASGFTGACWLLDEGEFINLRV